MTTAIATEVGRRRRQEPAHRRLTFVEDLKSALREAKGARGRIRWPSAKYREDPVLFFREILGVEPWSKQVEIIEAVRDSPRLAVASGHKVSKSHTAAGIALWYYSSFPDARVVMSSTTARQVDQILWRELQMMRARGGKCVACKAADPQGLMPVPCPHSALIEGKIGELARTGLKSEDFREIVGFTAREAEAVAGISGRRLLYIIDEASGVPDIIFEAIEGNRAGGARIVMFSNPTRTDGEFFRAFHGKKTLYRTIQISSEETPNVVEGRIVVEGLATREWVDEKREEWGEDSPIYRVRVKGEFALNEDGKIFSVHAITEAEQRWHDMPDGGVPEDPDQYSRLYVGIDPAGASGTGDETGVTVRRGKKQVELLTQRGLDDDAHVALILAVLAKHRRPREAPPVVVVDREGAIGSSLYGALRSHRDRHPGLFELVGVRASDRATRDPMIYDRQRDALVASLESWVRAGGAIVEDVRLAAELHILEWKPALNGRLKVTPKDVVKKELGRSPDRFDSLALACWEPTALRDADPADEKDAAASKAARDDEDDNAPALNPYGGRRSWRQRR